MHEPYYAVIIPLGGKAPVDPGFGQRPPVDPGYGRPGWSPADPGYGVPGGPRPGHDLPWAPGRPGHDLPGVPGHPDAGLPPFPGRPDTGLPWAPVRPDHGLPPAHGLPSNPIYVPDPGTKPIDPDAPVIWPPLPPSLQIPALILVWVVGVGYRWLHSAGVDNTLPATPEPK
jgi:hypothetical protein